MSRIKKAKLPQENLKIQKPSFIKSLDGISFSFQSLNRTEFFDLNGTCQNWTSDLFNMMQQVSSIPKIDLIQNKYPTFRVHSHEKASPPSKLPDGIALRDFYQIRIYGSKGGIHGVFVDDVFYIVWLDPLHNLYPNERFGGLKKITPPNTCCMDRDEILFSLQQENIALKKENEEWQNFFENS